MGPNGAGKSTLVRILGGLLLPSSGIARVGGVDVETGGSAFRRRVAFVVGDERSFHYRVSGRANLHYFAALHGLSAGEARRRAAALLDRVGLADAADRRYQRIFARHAPAARAGARAARRSGGVAARRADAGPGPARRARSARVPARRRDPQAGPDGDRLQQRSDRGARPRRSRAVSGGRQAARATRRPTASRRSWACDAGSCA